MSKKKDKFYLIYFRNNDISRYDSWDKCKKVVQGNKQVLAFHGFYIDDIKGAEQWKAKHKALYGNLDTSDKLLLYSDGGCRTANHKRRSKNSRVSSTDLSSWAYVLVKNDNILDSNSGFNYGKTNNYQELNGCYHGLNAIKRLGYSNEDIIIVTDSKYLISVLNYDWDNKDSSNKPNRLAGIELYKTFNSFENILVSWVKGHANNKYNNMCDNLCTEQIKNHY